MAQAEMTFELKDLPADCVIVEKGQDNTKMLACAEEAGVLVLELTPDAVVTGIFSLRRLSGSAHGATANAATETATADASVDAAPTATPPAAMHGLEAVCLLLHTSGTVAMHGLEAVCLLLHTSGTTVYQNVV